MKTKIENPRLLTSIDIEPALFKDSLVSFLSRWRDRLGYLTIWAALPALGITEVQEAKGNENPDPHQNKTERNKSNIGRQNQRYPSSEFLKRFSGTGRSQTSSPVLSSLLGGTDNCPGQPIPAGNYTAAAPFSDNGTTVGANNTVNSLYCYYCTPIAMNGPDVIYRFKMTAAGPNPKITVVPTSDNFDARIYLLDTWNSGGCRYGTSNDYVYNLSWMQPNGRTVVPDISYLGSRPVYLYVDSPSGTGGNYTINVQDITLAQANWPAVPFDFDGDFRSDVSFFRPSDGKWHLILSQIWTEQVHSWGLASDKITPADFDGDGVVDMAVYRPSEGKWYIVNSATSSLSTVSFGLNGDMPQPQDFDGDLKADFGLWRPSNATWYIGLSGSGAMHVQQWGLTGDKPVANDFSGDGKAELAVYRPSEGKWYTFNLVNGVIVTQQWGLTGDYPVPGDYDGDVKSDFAVYRPSNGKWYRINSTNLAVVEGPQYAFPAAGDLPLPGDYSGDGRFDTVVFSPSQGRWYFVSDGGWGSNSYGASGDIPAPSAFVY